MKGKLHSKTGLLLTCSSGVFSHRLCLEARCCHPTPIVLQRGCWNLTRPYFKAWQGGI